MAHKLKNGADAHILTKEENGKGGTNKGKNHRAALMFKEYLDGELQEIVTINGVEITMKQAMMMKMIRRCLSNDITDRDLVRLAEFVRDTIGEKPVEKVMMSEVSQETIDEVQAYIDGKRNEQNT